MYAVANFPGIATKSLMSSTMAAHAPYPRLNPDQRRFLRRVFGRVPIRFERVICRDERPDLFEFFDSKADRFHELEAVAYVRGRVSKKPGELMVCEHGTNRGVCFGNAPMSGRVLLVRTPGDEMIANRLDLKGDWEIPAETPDHPKYQEWRADTAYKYEVPVSAIGCAIVENPAGNYRIDCWIKHDPDKVHRILEGLDQRASSLVVRQ